MVSPDEAKRLLAMALNQLLNVTTIPRLTRCASSLASQFVMRTQPCEAFLSIFEGSGVPCRP